MPRRVTAATSSFLPRPVNSWNGACAGRIRSDAFEHHRPIHPTFRVRVARFLLGLPTPLETVDRTVLETIIFPYFCYLPDVQSVLLVGCDWYTRHYEDSYFSGKEYWTIDAAPGARKFAGRKHVIASLEQLDRHFSAVHFDLIVCNGVFGYGLNGISQFEEAFRQCRLRLRAGGYLVMAWDDIPAHRPVPIEAIKSLKALDKFGFPPLGSWRYTTNTEHRHTYDFYRRAQPGDSVRPR